MNAMQDKVVLVTGAGSGFGRGIATHMADAGARVGVLDLNHEHAHACAADIGERALPLTADVTSTQDMAAALDALQAWAGPLTTLVNNAGVAQPPTPLEDVTEAAFDQITAVNMRAIYTAARLTVPLFKAQGGGAMLNIASTAGVSPRPGLTWYNASKGWVITATRSMAVELAADKIRVNALNPVAGDTPMLRTFLGEDTPDNRQKFLDTIPLGRFSTPDDLGAAAVFLCSDAASLITGVALEVDGGRCI